MFVVVSVVLTALLFSALIAILFTHIYNLHDKYNELKLGHTALRERYSDHLAEEKKLRENAIVRNSVDFNHVERRLKALDDAVAEGIEKRRELHDKYNDRHERTIDLIGELRVDTGRLIDRLDNQTVYVTALGGRVYRLETKQPKPLIP
jgi:predicted nuclease with TOPRIM domain